MMLGVSNVIFAVVQIVTTALQTLRYNVYAVSNGIQGWARVVNCKDSCKNPAFASNNRAEPRVLNRGWEAAITEQRKSRL